MTLRVGSLFAGIGGFDIAAESFGWSTAWVSEIDPFCCATLEARFPSARNLGDIRLINWNDVEPVDLLVGGFPCQPHSTAGRREGSADERDLWPEFRRAIGVLRPRYVVGENVSAVLTSERGRYYNRLVSDLAALGYAVEWDCLSAADVGAPHGRDRLWIVAYTMGDAVESRPQRQRRNGDDGHQPGRLDARAPRPTSPACVRLRDWRDAVPFAGADGKVRLIPAGALRYECECGALFELDLGKYGCPNCLGDFTPVAVVPADSMAYNDSRRREFERLPLAPDEQRERGDEPHRRTTPIRGDDARQSRELGDASSGRRGRESWRGTGQEPTDGHREFSRGEAQGPGAQSEVRALADGISDGLARRDLAAESASLWPVSYTEPGRVAKLRAIGNAIVPLCAVVGPFARVAELERARVGEVAA